ncbi:MAG TPA: STAS domain-containing protein, partial [Xenococcaceae cyanobacterium]
AGSLDNSEYRRLGREAAAFYNTWFLDPEDGAVYFNVLADGLPYLTGGNERGKGSHSMSGYHSFELAYLSCVYTNLLITKQPMDLYFKPKPGGFPDNMLRVAPDLLPPGSVRISEVWIDEQQYFDFDAENLTIQLPSSQDKLKVRVRVIPARVLFDATVLEVTQDTAKIFLSGVLDASAVEILQKALEKALAQRVKRVVFLLQDLESISTNALRTLIFAKQKLDSEVEFYLVGARESVKNCIQKSEFYESVTMLDEYDTSEMLAKR